MPELSHWCLGDTGRGKKISCMTCTASPSSTQSGGRKEEMKPNSQLGNFGPDFWSFFQLSHMTELWNLAVSIRDGQGAAQPGPGRASGRGQTHGSLENATSLPLFLGKVSRKPSQSKTFSLGGFVFLRLKFGWLVLEGVISGLKIAWFLLLGDKMWLNNISKERGLCLSRGKEGGSLSAFVNTMKWKNYHLKLGKINYFIKFLSAIPVPNFTDIYYIHITQLHSQGMSFVRKPPGTAFLAPKGATAPAQQWWLSTALGCLQEHSTAGNSCGKHSQLFITHTKIKLLR